jgi:hypothetical protein
MDTVMLQKKPPYLWNWRVVHQTFRLPHPHFAGLEVSRVNLMNSWPTKMPVTMKISGRSKPSGCSTPIPVEEQG